MGTLLETRRVFSVYTNPLGVPQGNAKIEIELLHDVFADGLSIPQDKFYVITSNEEGHVGEYEAALYTVTDSHLNYRIKFPTENKQPLRFSVPPGDDVLIDVLINLGLLPDTLPSWFELNAAMNAIANAAVSVHESAVVAHTPAQVGLSNVNNTSDVNKPVSTAQQLALDLKANRASPVLTGTPTAPTAAMGTNTTQIANTAFVLAALAALVNSSPAALDTLNELAAALGNDANFAATMTNALANKVNTTDILNALTQTISGKVLDARQGKILKDLIDVLQVQANSNTTALAKSTKNSKGAMICDDATYNGFPSVATLNGVIYAVWKTGALHVSDGKLMLSKSFDDGATWTTPSQIVVGGTPLTGIPIEIGTGSNNRLVIGSNPADGSVTKFAYSDDFGATWTASTTIPKPVGHAYTALHGAIIRQSKGTLLAPYFSGTQTNGSVVRFGTYKSTDNGATWTTNAGTLNGTWMGAFDALGSITESSIAVAVDGATDAQDTLVGILRDDNNFHYHHLIVSTDGGASWTDRGKAFGEQNRIAGYSFPVNLYRKGDAIYAICGWRGVRNGNFFIHDVRFWKVLGAQVVADGNWGDYRKIYTSISERKGQQHNDWGYLRLFETSNGELKAAYYDTSINYTPQTSGFSDKQAIATISLSSPVIIHAFKYLLDGTADINAPATKTAHLLNYTTLDTHAAQRGDGRIYAPETGLYYVSFAGTTSTAINGATWFRVGVEAVDVAGLTAISAGGATWDKSRAEARRLACFVNFAPSATVGELNRFSGAGQVFLYKGERIELFIEHNGSAAIPIVNSVYAYHLRMTVTSVFETAGLHTTPAPVPQLAAGRTNWARAGGVTVTATDTNSASYPASGAVDGDRRSVKYAFGGVWVSATNATVGSPKILEIDFGQNRTFDEINVIGTSDTLNNVNQPQLTDVFYTNGIVAFTVDCWNGTAWVNLATVTGNNKVWRQFTFAAVTGSKVRVSVTSMLPATLARIAEVEVIG